MQRFQKSFNAFIEQFQDRWETQPAFRATWSTLGAGTFLLILCVAALVGSNLFSSLFASGGDTTRGSVIVAVNGNVATFPINQLTPQGTDASGTKASPVATSTYSVSPTPTVTPAGPTATPTDTGTGTPTGTPFTVSASQPSVWKAGQPGFITGISTSPPVPSVIMTILLQFGNPAENCIYGPISVPLDSSGTHPAQVPFPVPNCFTETNASVVATYQIAGHPDATGAFAAKK